MASPRASLRKFAPEQLFRPETLAVIGAGAGAGARIAANIRAAGFGGTLLEIGGEPADSARDVAALPVAPDLAIVAVRPEMTEPILAALATRGGCTAVVTGPAPDLRDAARRIGIRVLGPDSFGIAVPALGLNATRAHLQPRPGRLALVSQSASLSRSVLDWAEALGLGFSHVVGIGENADIGFGMVLDWLSRDPGTGTILLDINRIKNRRAFISAARAAARMRPVVAMRAGGRLLDPSGAAEATFAAALRRAGVLTVSRYEDLLAAAETLTRAPPLRTDALAIVTNAIGPGNLAADAALRDGVPLAEFSAGTIQALNISLPVDRRPTGPIHVQADAPTRLAETAAMLAGTREVGGVLVVHAPTGDDGAGIAALAAAGATMRVPLLVCAMGEASGARHRQQLAEAGLPVFPSPEQAMRGMAHLLHQRRARQAARELPPGTVLTVAPDRDCVARLFAAARRDSGAVLTQHVALEVVAAYGIETASSEVATTPEDAAEAATGLGFPVVLKRRRTDPPDDSAPGALAFDLESAEDVARAAQAMIRRTSGAADETHCAFIVQRQVARAREVMIRVVEDAVFGPAIAFGQGGTAAAIIGDLAYDLPPLNLSLAHALIARTRAARLLDAFRDQKAADRDALAETLVRVSQLIVDFPEIATLEINPLFASDSGACAADAWIRLRPQGQVGMLAIPPYPAELAEECDLGGQRLTIRPIRPEDAAAHEAMFGRMSPEDVRYRFFSSVRELSPEQIARMTQVDYEREMALVAVRTAQDGAGAGQTVGVARLVREPPGHRAEFAVAVQPDMKGKGLATRLMRRLIEWARGQGVTEIVGQVLSDNAPMLGLVRRLGFRLRRMEGEEDVIEARLKL